MSFKKDCLDCGSYPCLDDMKLKDDRKYWTQYIPKLHGCDSWTKKDPCADKPNCCIKCEQIGTCPEYQAWKESE